MRIVVALILLLTISGCGTKAAVRKDWGTRSEYELQHYRPGSDVPLYATAEDFECRRDGTRLQEIRLSGSPAAYSGKKEEIVWYCPAEDIYWILYREGIGGGLKVQWFGPYDVPKKKSKKTQDKETQSGNRGFLI